MLHQLAIGRSSLLLCVISFSFTTHAQQVQVASPDGKMVVTVSATGGKAFYAVNYHNRQLLEPSPLGLLTSAADFAQGLTYTGKKDSSVQKAYELSRIKTSRVRYNANVLTCYFTNQKKQRIAIEFQVSNNNLAFRYHIDTMGQRLSCVVEKEVTGFRFPSHTTTFLSPMMAPMTGFGRSAPSYESGYQADAPMNSPDKFRKDGFVFPSLFHVGSDGWVLLSETGVSSLYCGAHLGDRSADGVYTVEYPDQRQNNGFGSSGAAISLPGVTPWRTITVGETLKPIVETTVPFDVVDQLYEPSIPYRFGKASWSWIVWQDASMNYDDQVTFIDLAAKLNWQFILIDALWDTNIGRDRLKKLVAYARSKKIDVILWYNSNGAANDAPQGPRNRMNTAIARKQEMKWLQQIGVKGMKVDFFGGDKQETMRLYEDILSDANDFGLFVDFHGATLPRGWERMYPNYAGSEAVLASEMLIFSQGVRNTEAFNATLHPFIRNAVGSMEFGGVLLNRFLTKSNQNRNARLTTDAFQLATAILFQNPVQMFGLTPNNLTDAPLFAIDFMKEVPTTWDETVFVDGYPGKFVVIARRHGSKWYVAGANAGKEPIVLSLRLPMLAGKQTMLYNDDATLLSYAKEMKIASTGEHSLTIQPSGGFVLQSR